ncbi:anoctamin-7-like [Pectinophora gossypiella]|uniref:anoctamin-7-like n=1 Tax=Pectinophora gossypiella TaxID=13191 RepID=UPI00214DF6B9|nr:anoctamin-7-like [Pectinophora gossypiella]
MCRQTYTRDTNKSVLVVVSCGLFRDSYTGEKLGLAASPRRGPAPGAAAAGVLQASAAVRRRSCVPRSIGGAESLKMNGFKKKNNTKERLANRATNVLVALASLHRVSWTLTSLEGHLSFERFEKSLISKYFFYSFVFTSSLVVCFGWLKGVFHSGNMLDTWDIKLNISTPWSTYNVAAPLRSIIRRAVTLNCPFFSCFYEGVVVFVTTILFRDVLVRVVTIIRSRGRGAKEEQQAAGAPVSTCEREYRLPPVTDQQVVDDFNTLFLQLALVTLFAPMFPLAPLLALAVNSLDMRSKASMYTTRHRRALLFRSAGIGYWNHVLKLVCYAAPLFHVMTTHAEYIQTNKDRIYNQYNKSFAYWFNTSATYLMSHRSDGCKTSTYLTSIYYDYEIMTIDDRGHEWPHQWNHLGENYTGSTTTPTYYFLQNFKFICILLYIIVFAALAVAVWQAVRGCPGAVARRQQRERVLRRWHQHRLPSLRRRFP